jgi:GT2 family glycosyltransferase
MIKVSIIIVHYNTYDLTQKCVASIYQFTPSIFEIIIVNNSDIDKPIEELKNQFPEIQIVHPNENLGFAKGNNLGIQYANGEHILLLNSDTELTVNCIEPALKNLEENNKIGVVSIRLNYPNGNAQANCQSFPSITGEILEFTRLFKLLNRKWYAQKFQNSLLNLSESHFCDWVWGAFFLFRKNDLMKLKSQKLSDSYFMYGEDMEWCYQFKEIGLSCFYDSSLSIIHYVGQSEFGNDLKKNTVMIQNELTFIKKYKGSFYCFCLKILKGIKFRIQAFKTPELKIISQLYYKISAKK